jgi:hypothetical protein
MVRIDDTTYCDGCGVEILLSPVMDEKRHYCCQDCLAGYECDCVEPVEIEYDQQE